MKGFIDKLFGKFYGDKGYISKRARGTVPSGHSPGYQASKEHENQAGHAVGRCHHVA